MKITIDLNRVILMAVFDAFDQTPPLLKEFEISKNPEESIKRMANYIEEYSNSFNSVLKQKIRVRLTESIAMSIKNHGNFLVSKKDS